MAILQTTMVLLILPRTTGILGMRVLRCGVDIRTRTAVGQTILLTLPAMCTTTGKGDTTTTGRMIIGIERRITIACTQRVSVAAERTHSHPLGELHPTRMTLLQLGGTQDRKLMQLLHVTATQSERGVPLQTLQLRTFATVAAWQVKASQTYETVVARLAAHHGMWRRRKVPTSSGRVHASARQ